MAFARARGNAGSPPIMVYSPPSPGEERAAPPLAAARILCGREGRAKSGRRAGPDLAQAQGLGAWARAVSAQALAGLDPEQTHVAPGRRQVGAAHPLAGKTRKIVGAAGLWARARQAFAAEGLRPHHGSDLIAVDVEVADPRPLGDELRHRSDPTVYGKGQPIARSVNGLDHFVEMPAGEGDDMQDRAEHLLREKVGIIERIDRGRDVGTVPAIVG